MSAESSYKTVSFKGGVHPANDGKALSGNRPIKTAPLLEKYQVIVHQNVGAPPKLTAEVGAAVKKGQLLAEAGGFVSVPLHSPTSGTVSAICDIPGPMGVPVQAIEIAADGKDEWGELPAPIDWQNADPQVIKNRIRDAGIVGMGGAAFPTHVKLSPPAGRKIDFLILNGAECEPYLTADHRLMLEEPDKVLEGAAILGKSLGVKKIYLGIETNKPDAIDMLLKKANAYQATIVGLKTQYPQGAEKQLIYAVTGRKVPAGGLPMDVGCVVQNVGTAAAVTDAITAGKPLIERITTVSGEPVREPGNWRFLLGTPVMKAIELAGGVNTEPRKLILGGPMMGFAQKSLEVTVMKNTSGILLLNVKNVVQYESNACIRCGKCLNACAMNLSPGPLSAMVESEKFDFAAEAGVMNCIECGSCAYVCPAHRPLVQHFRRAKAEIRRMLQNRKNNATGEKK